MYQQTKQILIANKIAKLDDELDLLGRRMMAQLRLLTANLDRSGLVRNPVTDEWGGNV